MIDMAKRKKASAGETEQPQERQPLTACACPGFVKDEEVGLGDIVKSTTYAFGIRPCGGCGQRAAALNRWVVFTR